jgi:protein-disulfide isomerase
MRLTKRILPVLPVIFVLLILGSGQVGTAQNRPFRPDSPIQVGRPDSSYQIVVYYDMQCPSCAAFHPKLKQVLEKFPDKIFVTFRHFPLTSMHDKAFLGAIAVEAANEQGKGSEMIDILLTNQSEWGLTAKFMDFFVSYAEKLGLDVAEFRKSIFGSRAIGPVIMDLERARSIGLKWTPSVFLNGKLLTFPESMELEKIILNGN